MIEMGWQGNKCMTLMCRVMNEEKEMGWVGLIGTYTPFAVLLIT